MFSNKIVVLLFKLMKPFFIIMLFVTSTLVSSQNDIFDSCRKGDLESVKAIYNKSPDIINSKNKDGYSPLILACYYGNIKVVSFLIDKINSVNGSSQYGSALMAAVVKGNLDVVKLLLDKNADPNITDNKGVSALHYAVMFKNIEITKVLIEAKADKNIKDNNGKSPLDYANMLKDENIISILGTW